MLALRVPSPHLEAALHLGSLSPQTAARLAALNFSEVYEPLLVSEVFREIGRAMASKRSPVSDQSMEALLIEAERLLAQGDREVANAVATDLLETLAQASVESGFDFSRADRFLGTECRSYLLAWDKFRGTRTVGLSR